MPPNPWSATPDPHPEGTWFRVSDDLVLGLHHTLNNRVAALSAAVQVLQSDVAADHPLRGVLAGELERLRATVELLSLLPRGRRGPEPVQLSDALAGVASLCQCHNLLRDLPLRIEEAPGLLPVWIEPSALTHALLVLVSAAGRAAQGRDAGEIRLRCHGDDRAITVEVSAAGGGERRREGGWEEEGLPDIDPRALEPLLREHGGTLEIRPDPAGRSAYRFHLPTLLEVRRRQRER